MTPLDIIARIFAQNEAGPTPEERDVARVIGDIIEGRATVADAVSIAAFAFSIAERVNPGIAAIATAEGIAVRLAPLIVAGIASGAIKPDPHPIADAQTTGRYQGR